VVATLFFAVFQQGSDVPLIGASGAVSGVLGCYFVWFPKNKVRLLTVLFWYIDVLLVPAKWVLGFYIVIENILPFIFASRESHVAHGAHIGGFLAGALIAYMYSERGTQHTEHSFFKEPYPSPITPTASLTPERFLMRAVQHRAWDEALQRYASMTAKQRQQLDADTVLALADGLVEEHMYDTALAILQGFIAMHPLSPDLPRAHMRAGYTLLRGKKRPQAAYQHFLSVLDLHPHPDTAALAQQAIAEIEGRVRT
jgi:hypothetical protein